MDIVQSDLWNVTEDIRLFEPFRDKTIFITGGTGFIGSMLVRAFVTAEERYGLNMRLIASVRIKEKALSLLGEKSEFVTIVNDLHQSCDFIIHTISPTKSKYFIEHPVETISSSVCTTMEILEVAKENKASMVYLSSMEQYGVPYETGQRMTEDQVGRLDHLNARTSYSESKRLCECLCASYAIEYSVDVKIARLSQTIGAGVSLSDSRMPMQFARAVVDGKDIVLHTEGGSVSNYVYITDAITGILSMLVNGKAGEAYNICNDAESRTVRDIADLVAHDVANGTIGVRIEKKDNMGYAPDVVMYLDSTKLRSIGWKSRVGMVEGYRRLVEYIKEKDQTK